MIQVRERRSERITGDRLKLEVARASRPALIVLLGVLVGIGCGLYLLTNVSRTLLSSTYQARIAVNDATGVVPGLDQVRYKGIPAGTISAVQLVGGQPVLTVEVQTQFGRIYRNAEAELRPNTPLQDMYLDIVNRGTPSAGLLGERMPLPATQTSTSVNIDDVLDVFNVNTRAELSGLLDNLGNGLADRGAALRTAFVEAVPFLHVVGEISQQLARRAPLTRALIHNAAILTTALASRQEQLRRLVSAGSSTLTTLAAGSGNLNATLEQLPPTLSAINSSFATLRGVLPAVDGAVSALEPVAGQLPSALAVLRGLSDSANPALEALRTPVRALVPLSMSLRSVAGNLSSAIEALAPQVGTIDHTTRDVNSCRAALADFFQWDVSMAKFGDASGPVPRGNLVIGADSSGAVASPSEFAPAACTPGPVLGGAVPTPAYEH